MKNEKMATGIIKLIAIAWIALLFFAITPPPYNIFFLLLNGIPLGIIYGLVFSYLEGRKTTELLGAVLASLFDPEFFVLGGRLPVSIAEALVDRMRIPTPASRWGRYPPQPKLALAQVRTHPVAVGAAALPMQRLFFA